MRSASASSLAPGEHGFQIEGLGVVVLQLPRGMPAAGAARRLRRDVRRGRLVVILERGGRDADAQLMEHNAVAEGQVTDRGPIQSAHRELMVLGPADHRALSGQQSGEPLQVRGAHQDLLGLRTAPGVQRRGLGGDQPTVVDDDQLVGHLSEFVCPLTGDEHGAALRGEGPQEAAQPAGAGRIEPIGGLVQDQHLRVTEQGSGQRQALAHALGVGTRPAPGHRAQADPFDDFVHPGATDALGRGQHHQVAARPAAGVEGPHVPDGAHLAHGLRQPPVGHPVEQGPPTAGLQPQHEADRGGLPRTRRAQEPGHMTGVDVEGEVVDGECGAITLGEVACLDHGVGSPFGRSRNVGPKLPMGRAKPVEARGIDVTCGYQGVLMSGQWEFWIDRGGTFTDVVGRAPDGTLRTCKLLSADQARYPDAGLAGIRRLLEVPTDAPIPAERIHSVRVGTTVATNALLERRGEPTALVITAGFTDALLIGRQHRPDIFARRIVRPAPLYARAIAFDERVAADGTVLRAPDTDRLRRDLSTARAQGIGAVAIACLHAHLYPAHELTAAAVAAELGFAQISCSSSTNPLLRVLPRAATTVVDAYLSPVVGRYLEFLAAELPGVALLVMTSHGGLAEPAAVHGKDVVLSGPAGGIVGMARLAQAAGYPAVIGFDMGGTSTDVSHWAGSFERRSDNHVAGVELRTPMLAISTIAAGGGSLLEVVDGRLRVGPRSAGADPGPMAYGRGGPLTLTDANVLLGHIQPAHFPAVFGPAGDAPLDLEGVREAFCALATGLPEVDGRTPSAEEVAAGFRRVAVADIADALRTISIGAGRDVTRYALVAFGGAGGQHACAVADAVGIDTVLVPPFSGLLCAV